MKNTIFLKTSLVASIAMTSWMIAGCNQAPAAAPEAAAAPAAAAPDQTVEVDQAPPQVVYEAPPPAPAIVGSVWIQPEYIQVGGQYQLRHGHYDQPPQGHTRWVASHYEHGAHGYAYIAGRWD
jgi:hypothetical protein